METKNLYLVRHAKAEEHTFEKSDFNRNLIPAGHSRAHRIAHDLAIHFIGHPNMTVISSSANRALQTAEIFCAVLDYPVEKIIQSKQIYNATHLEILKVINEIIKPEQNVVLFGHNPGLSDLTNYLCRTNIDLKTSNVAVITLEQGINFTTLSGGTANLISILS